MTLPLMPKATAVWLIEKTALTFTQIADFCGMHPLEVQAIADGEVAQGIVGYDPVVNGQVTLEDIRRCEADPNGRLKLAATALPAPKRLRGTALDPFGKAEVRRVERELPGEYRELVHGAVAKLHGANHDKVAEIAGLADMVRGYEDIKLRNVERFRERAAELTAAL